MDTALGRRCRVGVLAAALGLGHAVPAAAQVDLAGEWAARVHKDVHYKREPDGARFRPRPCDVTLPAATVR